MLYLLSSFFELAEAKLISSSPFSEDEISFASASSKKELKNYSKQDIDFVYFESKGRLFFNGNGVKKGWGDDSEGGLFAILKGKPELSAEDFTLLA